MSRMNEMPRVTDVAAIIELATSSSSSSRLWGNLLVRGLAVMILGGSIGDGSSGLPGSCARGSNPTAGSLGSLGRSLIQVIEIEVVLILVI